MNLHDNNDLVKSVDEALLRAANKACGTNYPTWESIPANPSPSRAPEGPNTLPPVPDPLNWKELPEEVQTLRDLVEYWRERTIYFQSRALRAESDLEDLREQQMCDHEKAQWENETKDLQ